MKKSTVKTIQYFIVLTSAISLWIPSISAQQAEQAAVTNRTVDTSSNQKEESLSDQDVEKILVSQGVPLTTNTPGIIANPDEQDVSKYTLGINDVIEIEILRHPEVSGQYVINNEGSIQFEFVGDVNIAGKTKKEVADIVKELLSKYIISPEVTVKITGYNSKVVYVIGEVGAPGKIYMRGDTITVREALVQAGLPLLSGKTRQGRVITPSSDGKPLHRRVDVEKLLYQGDLRENIVMQPGDTLYIPPTFLAKALRVIQPVAAPIGTAASTGRTVIAPF